MKERGFTASWLVAAALLASWAVSSASSEQRSVTTPAGGDAGRTLPDAARAVEVEVARLAVRRHAPAAAVPAGRRNPFAFEGRYAGAAPRAAARRDVARDEPATDGLTEAQPPADPVPALAGVAELGARFVAVISFAGALHYVSRGEVIAGRYRVDAIAPDGVDVFDLRLGTNSRLILRRP